MPYVNDAKSFIEQQKHSSERCVVLQREGQSDGVYGVFTSEITAASVPDGAVLKSLFDEAYATLAKDEQTHWTMNTLPISHFVGLYPLTILTQRHNNVVDIHDGQCLPVSAYMGVEK